MIRPFRSTLRLLACLVLLAAGASLAQAQTTVSGEITTDTTWTLAGHPYVTLRGTVETASGVTLTAEPGAIPPA